MAEKPDPELDELLDSAAKDFKKPEEPSTSNFDPSQFLNADGSINMEKWKSFQQEQEKVTEALYKQAQEEFESSDLAKELTQQLQDGLAAAAQEQGLTPEDISNRLKNLKLFSGQAPPAGDDSKEKEFSDAIMGAMQSLKENLSEAFPAARDGEEGDGDDASGNDMENLTNVMQQMMLALLSKEMLLPSFKEMSEKYPAWLEENKSKLSEEDLKRYTAQLEVVQKIVAELEKEGEGDKEHLDHMIELMGKAQELGQPPQELTAQLGNAIDDSKIDAMLKDSGADQCNIM
ncbi:peroxisomal biogenesis factor 19 isoform X1 [Thrips palmi]|uniref:Peroxin-19 n=1 Tax=Thrips palmi TaxID=161013 RepID=A0A6P8ZIP4_THRPL|nr:peroxisomal biogenesis factor 19 isoform X1 [Thrips palmi]XP_034233958.1 peroxisomal biogenesis factor 19 isoform X1 [Thrips palmi]XP_034233959.1 peroxisomal biogenesis factor 19 isoform X1 [Thrips palmi]